MRINSIQIPSLEDYKNNTKNKPSTPTSFYFQSDSIELKNKKEINTKKIVALSFLGLGAILGIINHKKLKNFINISNLKFSNLIQDLKYPQDVNYKTNLLEGLNLTSKDSYKLSSVVGENEFKDILKNLEKNPETYSPGTRIFDNNGRITGFTNENLENYKFGANLHIHTTFSDGKSSVCELLDNISKWADERYKKTKKPFIFALTDHDGVEGNKEALREIIKNPQKFKHVKFILGIEHTTKYENQDFLNEKGHIHILSYAINPFEDIFENLFNKQIEKNLASIEKAINKANSNLQNDFKYTLDDMLKIAPCLNYTPKSANFYLKDYLQFKLIFEKLINQNMELQNTLKETQLLSKISYEDAIPFIEKHPTYTNDEKYYDYYYKALKEYITNLAKEKNITLDENIFKEIPQNIKQTLNYIEQKVLNFEDELYIEPIDFMDFKELIKILSKTKNGTYGIAHPGVIFPANAIKNKEKMPELYDEIFKYVKNSSSTKTHTVERFYQSYFNDDKQAILDEIFKRSEKYNFLKTGGLDTHQKNFNSI